MSKHYAIQCTNCAAPLDLLGGGRINTVTCSYCHSTLDMNDDYKVLAKFNETKRPNSPFAIGMIGSIKGVQWIIIGWITYKTIDFPSETWHEFLLYSATHGYAWLVHEEDSISFSIKIRDFDLYKWQESKPMTVFYKKGHYLRKEEAYQFYVAYVEGELNSIVKFGDKFTSWDYSGVRKQTLSIEKYITEIEVFHTQELNKKTLYESFNLPYTATEKKEEKEEEEKTDNVDNYIYEGSKWLSILFALLILFSFFTDKTLFSNAYEVNRGNESENIIHITSDAFLGQLQIKAKDSSLLQDFSLKLVKKNHAKPYFYISKKKIFFKKHDLKNSWKYDSNNVTVYIKLERGTYLLLLKNTKNVEVVFKQSFVRISYILPMLFLLLGFLYYIHQTRASLGTISLFFIAFLLLIYFPFKISLLIAFIVFIFYFKKHDYD